MDDFNWIPAYLYYGYLPEFTPQSAAFLQKMDEDESHRPSLREPSAGAPNKNQLIQTGAGILRQVFRATIETSGAGKQHVLPLSGGLDSRAILGGLLENLDSSQIQAVTFGSPGTWDYEIGRQVARAAGIPSTSLDLTSAAWQWRMRDLLETAQHTARPTALFDAHVNRQIPHQFGDDRIYWSGFMADPLAGSHLQKEDSTSWEVACAQFMQRNRGVTSIDLTPPGFEPVVCLPAAPLLDSPLLTFDEQLDFCIRQQCLIAPIVMPSGYNYQTPFLHPDWVHFILNLPRALRVDQHLYKEILQTAYPKLFALPAKTNYGLPLSCSGRQRFIKFIRSWQHRIDFRVRRLLPNLPWKTARDTNYIDFDRALRTRSDIQETVYDTIQNLQQRQLVTWLDMDTIWQRHQQKYGNHADALMLLAALEINLKASDAGTIAGDGTRLERQQSA